MRIYDRNQTGIAGADTGAISETHASTRGSGISFEGSGGDGDRVELSGVSANLWRALTTESSGYRVRVQELADQYRNGLYQPDSRVVSQALVRDALDRKGE